MRLDPLQGEPGRHLFFTQQSGEEPSKSILSTLTLSNIQKRSSYTDKTVQRCVKMLENLKEQRKVAVALVVRIGLHAYKIRWGKRRQRKGGES